MIQPSQLPREVSQHDYRQPPQVVGVAFGETILSRTDISFYFCMHHEGLTILHQSRTRSVSPAFGAWTHKAHAIWKTFPRTDSPLDARSSTGILSCQLRSLWGKVPTHFIRSPWISLAIASRSRASVSSSTSKDDRRSYWIVSLSSEIRTKKAYQGKLRDGSCDKNVGPLHGKRLLGSFGTIRHWILNCSWQIAQ
jgi:hypothetical protein